MDLSITPVVLSLLLIGISNAQELVLNPNGTIVIHSPSKGLVINCEVVGMPDGQRANVQWLDTKGKVIKPYNYATIPRIYSKQMRNRNRLRFITLVHNDAGRYTCRGTIGDKVLTKDIQLIIKRKESKPKPRSTLSRRYISYLYYYIGPPSMKVSPTWSTPVIGKRFELTCIADGSPQPSFIFDKDKLVLSGDRYNVSVTKGGDETQGVLVIEDFRPTDQGTYSCIAFNRAGHVSRTLVIDALVPPVIEPVLNISEPEGNAAELVCVAKGDPAPVVTWMVKGSDIPITDSRDIALEYIQKQQPAMHFTTVKLKFARLERKHANNYTCSASSVAGTDEKEGNIAVEFKPNFADASHSAYGWVNHTTEIKCVVNAVPPPVLFWKHNNSMIIRGPFFGISSMQENKQTINILKVLVTAENENSIFGNYKCVARNYLGSAEKDIALKHAAVPSAPDVSIEAVSPTTISVLITTNWAGGQPIGAYKVLFYAEGDDQNKVSQLVPVNKTSQGRQTQFVINNLAPRQRYIISVVARNNVGYGAKTAISAMTQAVRPPDPPKVTSPGASDDPNSYKLFWEKPEAGGIPLTGYEIKYYQVELSEDHPDTVKAVVGDMEMLQIGQGDTTEFILTELMPNSTYEVQISALNPLGTSAATRKIFTTPPGELAPSAPVVSLGVVSPTTISVLITAKETGGQPIEAYKIVFYAEGDDQNKVSQLVPVNKTSRGKWTQFIIKNLAPRQRYIISVEARNNVGYGAKTAISAMTQAARPPDPPKVTSPRSSDDPHSYKLVWEKPETGGLPLTGYLVRYYQVELSEVHPDKVTTVVGEKKTLRAGQDDTTQITLTELMPNSTYELQIIAMNAIGLSMPTNKIFTTPPGGSLPSIHDVSLQVASVSPSTISLLITANWTGGQPTGAYEVVFYAEGDDQNKVSQLVPVNKTSQGKWTQFVISNLAPRQRYIISVEALNSVEYVIKASVSAMTQAIRPPDPPKVTSTGSSDDPNSYKLVWEKPETGGIPLTGYKIKYYQVELSEDHPDKVKAVVGDMEMLQIGQGDTTEFILTELMPNSTYEVQISALNPIGTSAATKKIFTTPSGGSVPSAPVVSIEAVSPTTISLLITTNRAGGQPIEAYKVVFYPEGDDLNKVSQLVFVNQTSRGMQTQFVINNLAPRQRYIISVVARNNVGYGAKTAISAMTQAVRYPNPPRITSPRSSDSPNSFKLVWEKPETGGVPLTGYEIKYHQVELSKGHPDRVEAVVGDMMTLKIYQSNVTEITLTELTPNSSYELVIFATNAFGQSMPSNTIFTTPPGRFMPNFADSPYSSTYGWVNHKTEIKCVANAVPLAAITWMHNNAVITNGPNFNIRTTARPGQTTSRLEVSVNIENKNTIFGKYMCAAENVLGVAEKAIALIQAEKPSAPSISADKVTSSSIRLLIAKEQETGGLPIKEYRVVHYAKGNVKEKVRRTVPVNTDSEDTHTVFFIDHLEAGVQYFIRVMAGNNLGYGAKAKMSVRTPFITVPSAPSLSVASTLVYFTEGDDESRVTRMTPLSDPFGNRLFCPFR